MLKYTLSWSLSQDAWWRLRRRVRIYPVLCDAEAELKRAGSVYQKDVEENGPHPS